MRQENGLIDVVNYLAIVSLEKLGNFEPTQKEITSMEKYLSALIEASINHYKYTFLEKSKDFDYKNHKLLL